MTDLDTNLIAHDLSQARGYLTGDPDVDTDRGEVSLKRVIEEHVDALLCHIEERDVNADEAYVRGLRTAVRWLATFDHPLPDFGSSTCRILARGLEAFADSTAKRLGVDSTGEHSAPDDRAAPGALALGGERPAPVGSWWQTEDGAAYVDGDYLDGPGDQIVTYVLHRPDGGHSYGKWGGREFADAYTRLDGRPAWLAAEVVAEAADA